MGRYVFDKCFHFITSEVVRTIYMGRLYIGVVGVFEHFYVRGSVIVERIKLTSSGGFEYFCQWKKPFSYLWKESLNVCKNTRVFAIIEVICGCWNILEFTNRLLKFLATSTPLNVLKCDLKKTKFCTCIHICIYFLIFRAND